MPYKFRRYVPKGFSRKACKARKSVPYETSPSVIELCDAEVQTDEVLVKETADSETQTNDINFKTVGVQTDKDLVKIAETQTDTTEVHNVEVQAGEPLSRDEPNYCVGNNDDKFIPLITKHKGLFKDSTGICYMC